MRPIVTLMALLAALLPSTAFGQAKKRIAIMDFDYATVLTVSAGIFGTNVDIGKGIADLMVDRLVNDGTYSVIERKALDKLIAEQNFSNSDRADPSSAARIGKLLGVNAIVVGSITQFGRDDKHTNIGGSAIGGLTGRYGLGGIGKKEAKAVVQISARLVNVETGEILAVAEGKGESERSGTSLIGSGGNWNDAGSGGINMGSSNFANTILGEAVNKAVTQAATQLDESAAKLPTVVIKVDGMVADVNGATLVLNVGTSVGVQVGDHLQVLRTGREIKDPATGKVLRRTDTPLGDVVITESESGSSVGTFTGNAAPKVGDHVKK